MKIRITVSAVTMALAFALMAQQQSKATVRQRGQPFPPCRASKLKSPPQLAASIVASSGDFCEALFGFDADLERGFAEPRQSCHKIGMVPDATQGPPRGRRFC
jgi:hypothetical protein